MKNALYFFEQKDYDKALEIAQTQTATKTGDSPLNFLIIGRVLIKKEEYEEAMQYFELCKQLLSSSSHPPVHLAVYHLWLGVRHLVHSMYEEALVSFLKSERIFSKLSISTWWEEDNLMYLYYNLGALYYSLNFFDDSKIYCDKALLLAEKNNANGIGGSISNIRGNMAIKANNFEETKQYYEKYLNSANTPIKKFIYLCNMGELAMLNGLYDEALEYFNGSIDIGLDSNIIRNKIINSHVYSMLGETYANLEQFEQAEKFQLKALQIINSIKDKNYIIYKLYEIRKKTYQSLCKLYARQEQYKKAYTYSQQFIELQANELNFVTDAKIADLRIRYEKQTTNEIVEEFSQKIEALETANSHLAQIASSISHDVRAPLRNAIRYLGSFKHKYGETLNEDANERINTALEAARDAEMLTKSLSDLGKIDKESANITEVNLNEIIRRTCKNLEQVIQAKNVVFEVPELPTIIANEGQMLQLFQNLIANAIKYNEATTPTVTITYETTAEKQHLFSVADNGIGIAPEYHEQIFKMLKRLHTNEEYKGSGLGLAICALIVQSHEGKIWVESQSGQGATFKFTIANE